VPLGEQVGYAVRFSDQTSDRTLIKVMTDGLLLMGVSDFERQIITGVVILVAVVLDAYRRRLGDRIALSRPAQTITVEPVKA